MLFRRRNPLSFTERLRLSVWPRHSWGRSLRYFGKRVLRLNATPHAIGAGVAAGVAASVTPFLGFHFIISAVIAYVVRGNMLAAAIGTAVGNPVTLPFFFLASYEVGSVILGRAGGDLAMREISRSLMTESFASVMPILKPMTIGSVPIAVFAGVVVYFITRSLVQAYQSARRDRLAARVQSRPREVGAVGTGAGRDSA